MGSAHDDTLYYEQERQRRAKIEAAARAMCLHRKHPSLEDPKVCEQYWQTHGSRRMYLDLARVALEAAAAI